MAIQKDQIKTTPTQKWVGAIFFVSSGVSSRFYRQPQNVDFKPLMFYQI